MSFRLTAWAASALLSPIEGNINSGMYESIPRTSSVLFIFQVFLVQLIVPDPSCTSYPRCLTTSG